MSEKNDVYLRLKAGILSLQFMPGAILQENAIGDAFGVSRTPAREALRDLVSEGLVTKYGRFYQVKIYSAEEVRQLYEIREALECLASRLATERAPDAELLRLKERLASHYEAVSASSSGFTTDASAFHMGVVQLSENDLLVQQLGLIHDKVIIISRLLDYAHRNILLRALDDHFRIIDAMLRRNPVVAEEEMRHHIRASLKMYLQYVEKNEAQLGDQAAVPTSPRLNPAPLLKQE